jgi:hypothetical protein
MTMNAYQKRFLFTVHVPKAICSMIYSVAGTDEVSARASLKAGDQNCMLIYDEVHLQEFGAPVYIGLDTSRRRPNA